MTSKKPPKNEQRRVKAQSDFAAIARDRYPKEACAIYTQGGAVVELENLHPVPNRHFLIDVSKAKAIEGGIELWHSHTNGHLAPSERDLVLHSRINFDGRIFCLPQQQWVDIPQGEYRAPLLGRQWFYGFNDCASIVIDAYAELGISIKHYDRPPLLKKIKGRDLYCWHDPNFDYYSQLLAAEGFEKVTLRENELPRNYDVLLFRYQCKQENHLGVYLVGGRVLHHLIDSLSSRDPYLGLKDVLSSVWRHKDLEETDARTIRISAI